MSAHKKNPNHALLAQFSGQDSFITIPKIYQKLTGCLNKAYLLNQIIFYSNKSTYCKDDWFYKSYEEWQEEIDICLRTLRNHFKEFENNNWIDIRVAKIKGKRTNFFRPRMDNILADINKMIENDSFLNSKTNKQNDNESPQGAQNAELNKNVPKRQKMPDSYSAKNAVSNTYIQITTSDKKTTTSKTGGSGLSKTKKQMLEQKLLTDERSDEEFLENCAHHIKNNSVDTASDYKKTIMLIALLKILAGQGEHFVSKGYLNEEKERIKKQKIADELNQRALVQEKQHWERMEKLKKEQETSRQSKPSQERRGSPTRLADMLKSFANANA